MSVDTSLVDRIVRGVLQGLQAPAAAPRPVASPPARQASTTPAATVSPSQPPVRLSQPVVTAEVLEGQVPRGSREIIVTPKAILTPAALDVVRARKLWVQREAAARPAAPTATRRLAIVVRSTPALDRLLLDRPGDWRRELLGCPDDAARLAIASLTRGDADVIALFASQHFRAACLANRHERIRAVPLRSLDELAIVKSQMRVNVVCIDPTGRADFELRRWLDAIGQISSGLRAPAAVS